MNLTRRFCKQGVFLDNTGRKLEFAISVAFLTWQKNSASLFAGTTRSTRLTHAGSMFLGHVRRVFVALQQGRESVQAAAGGFKTPIHSLSEDSQQRKRRSRLRPRSVSWNFLRMKS